MIHKIYLDTNLWNRLFERNVNPEVLRKQLEAKNATLVVSGQTIYELAKTFVRDPDKAKKLFQYLKAFIDAGIPCAHDNMEQLVGELRALHNRVNHVIAFYGPSEYADLRIEVDKLAQGIFDERAKTFTAERQQFSQDTRSGQKAHLDTKQPIKDDLKTVSQQQLKSWLDSQVIADKGAAMLTVHLRRKYPSVPLDSLINDALVLLGIPASRIAKGVVRADLYYNWRCANRDSNPKDLIDDMYHILNASYCETYATAESKQDEYASLLLSPQTKVAIYDEEAQKMPVEEWLLSLV